MSTLQNQYTIVSLTRAVELSTEEILANLGWVAFTDPEIGIPIWAVVAAAFAIQDLIGLFSGGRPKFEDTVNVIQAYNKSAYWPLHALADNLTIAMRNGAPISDSNPAIQAQFSAWKLGTIESIQRLAGFQGGETDPGFWQLQNLINLSWAYSGQGEDMVLNVVKWTDAFTIGLSLLFRQQPAPRVPPPPVPPPVPPPPPPLFGPCAPIDPQVDEIMQSCIATQQSLAQILAAIQNLAPGQGGAGAICCAQLVAAITNVARQIAIIAAALAFPPTPGAPVDLTPIVNALTRLDAAVAAVPGAVGDAGSAISSSIAALADKITPQPPPDLGPVVKAIDHFAQVMDIKPAVVDYLVKGGYIDAAAAQVVTSADFGDWFITHLTTWAYDAVKYVMNALGLSWDGSKLNLRGHDSTVAKWIEDSIASSLALGASPLYAPVKGLVNSVLGLLKPAAPVVIGDVHVDQDVLISETLAPALLINGICLLISFFDIGGTEQLKFYVDMFSEFTSLQEIRELRVGQRMKWGPMRQAEMEAKAIYRQELAGAGTMAGWVARGLYDRQAYTLNVGYTGLPREHEQATLDAAEVGIQPFLLIRLMSTGLFTPSDLADELQFRGIRSASAARLLRAAPYIATAAERKQLESSLVKAHTAGLMSDADLIGNIDSAEQNVTRDNLILQHAKWEKLIAETKKLESEYSALFLGGLIDDPTYRSFLAGIGLQPDMIDTLAGQTEARANAALHKKEIAAQLALARATAAKERQAAVEGFVAGTLNAAGLLTALLATGLTAAQAAAWTTIAALRQSGAVSWIYGLRKSPAEKQLLRERVGALTDQRKRLQITDTQYTSALAALGLPPSVINALDAAADAMVSPKKSAFAIPVETT